MCLQRLIVWASYQHCAALTGPSGGGEGDDAEAATLRELVAELGALPVADLKEELRQRALSTAGDRSTLVRGRPGRG